MFLFSRIRTTTPIRFISGAYAEASGCIRNYMDSHGPSPQNSLSWHEFNPSTQQWMKVEPMVPQSFPRAAQQTANKDSPLVLATWNVDAFAELPQLRISGIISHLTSLTPAADIIFLQEVSRVALSSLLADARICESWYSSEAGIEGWHGAIFATVTLLSKARFAGGRAAMGPVWRVKFESKFRRDALCCDIFVPSSETATSTKGDNTRIRLINVHLDSLAIVPSLRPGQLSLAASILRSAERGIIAGDFNPVLPEDRTLVEDNGLIDAWGELRKGEDGFTWGMDGKEPFPPGRLDKVALLGLVAHSIEVMHPGAVEKPFGLKGGSDKKQESDDLVPWSDHSGLKCTFGLV